MNMWMLAGLAAMILASAAQAQDVPPGEKPVDPYTVSNSNAGASPITDPKVFAAFHGLDGVRRVTSDLVDANVNDPRIKDIFATADIPRLKRTLAEQFCYVLGGGCDYTGRDMTASHKDQGLQVRDFNILVENLQKAMDKEGVPSWAQNKLLAKFAPMKRDMIER